MIQLTKRQLNILDFIEKQGSASNDDIKEYLHTVSRTTIVRDLNILLKYELLEREGSGRSVRYREKIKNEALRFIDIESYFEKGPDERKSVFDQFNFEIFQKLNNLFTSDELLKLTALNEEYKKRIASMSPTALQKEFERLIIELAWKSSHIEGNTYSLIDTEILIKEHKEAVGHTKEEAVMIMNHKKAFDYILDKRNDFKTITIPKTENIHSLIVNNLGVQKGLRKTPVGIIGTRYKPLNNEHQVREAMEKMTMTINKLKDPFSKALIEIVLLSYIQPFEDGNKRTARILGDAILLAHDACPLSFRSVDEADYKKALILFYEQNNIKFFKELFIEQFKFATENYFLK